MTRSKQRGAMPRIAALLVVALLLAACGDAPGPDTTPSPVTTPPDATPSPVTTPPAPAVPTPTPMPWPSAWRRADGTLLPFPPLRSRAGAWSRDGTSYLVLEDAALKAVADDGGDALRVRLVGVIPAAGLQGDVLWIAGMNDWAVIIQGDDGMVTVVTTDGSAPARTFEGALAAVSP
jgi:hypothetical protein